MTLLHMCEGFSCLKEEADNCDIIRLCHCHFAYTMKGWLYRGACMNPGGSSLVHLVLLQILPLVHS